MLSTTGLTDSVQRGSHRVDLVADGQRFSLNFGELAYGHVVVSAHGVVVGLQVLFGVQRDNAMCDSAMGDSAMGVSAIRG